MNGNALQIQGSGKIVVAATSAAVDLTALIPDLESYTVILLSNTDLYWRSGKTSPTAVTTDAFLPAGVAVMLKLPYDHRFIAAIRNSADGVLGVYVVS